VTQPTDKDRILNDFRALVRSVIVEMGLAYSGRFEYVIQGVDGEPPDVTVSCTPSDTNLGLPELAHVAMSPGIVGMTSLPDTGIVCEVVFLNRDPTKPRIVGVGSLGILPVARVGDQVMMFLPPTAPIQGVINGTSMFVGTISIASPTSGIITQGSAKVFTG